MVLKVQAKGGFTSDFIISQETLTMRAHRGGGLRLLLDVWKKSERARERERDSNSTGRLSGKGT